MNFIGIDLAWTLKNETGICIINEKGEITTCESKVFSNKEIAEIVLNHSKEGAIVAIDAPLIINNENGSRAAEGLVMKDKIHGRHLSLFNSSRNYMSKTYGCIRGEDIVKEIMFMNKEFKLTSTIKDEKHYIFETFPTGISLGLFPESFPIKYKIKSKIPISETKVQMLKMLKVLKNLERYNPSIKNVEKYFNSSIDIESFSKAKIKHLEDKLDALLCAYCAYWHYVNRSKERVYGDDENGFIVLPVVDEAVSIPVEDKPVQKNIQNNDFSNILEVVKQVHVKNHYDVGTKSKETMMYRMSLMIEELGKISQCVTKGEGDIAEKHAELLILLLGNCITMDIDIIDEFWKKMKRKCDSA